MSSSRFLNSRAMAGYSIVELAGIKFRVPKASLSTKTDKTESTTPGSEGSELGPQTNIKIFIPDTAMGLVIGPKGANIKTLRSQTRAKVDLITEPIPRDSPDEEERNQNFAVITGTQSQVDKAESILNGYIGKAQSRGPKPTHFLSLPIVTGMIDQFQSLQSQIIKATSLPSSTLVSPQSIHLTIGLLSLTNPAAIDNAKQLLKSLQPKLYNLNRTQPLHLHIRGLDTFPENDPENARVLYGKVLPDSNFERAYQSLISQVRSKFSKAGILLDLDRPLQIHATLLKLSSPSTFNAAPLLTYFKSHHLGPLTLTTLQLSPIGSCPPDGDYEVTQSVQLS